MKLQSLLAPLGQAFDNVLPPRCPACGVIVDGDDRFCGECWGSLAFLGALQCDQCGVPFAHERGAGALCGACLAEPPLWRRARAAMAYDGAARTALLRFKLADRQHLARMMAAAMLRAARADGLLAPGLLAPGLLAPGVLLVPVLLHRWQLWRRGFNQALLLARELARASGAGVSVDGLVRVRDPGVVAGRAVVLVDDVLTSGATADACTKTLLAAGDATVDVLTFARVVREGERV